MVCVCVFIPYLEEADAAACVWSREMLVIIKVDITQEPGVCKLLSGTVKSLVAAQMSSCSMTLGDDFSVSFKKKNLRA